MDGQACTAALVTTETPATTSTVTSTEKSISKRPAPAAAKTEDETPLCVVCLQQCPGEKACHCSFMHKQCAESYISVYGACRVCAVEFKTDKLAARAISEDEAELESRARKRQCLREEAERAANVEWARFIAPSAAHILYRHFRHSGDEPQAELGFGTIVLSLLHSGEQYIEDLSERLAESRPKAEVDAAVKRLLSVGDALVSAHETVDDTCSVEFMHHFRATLAERTHAPFRWSDND